MSRSALPCLEVLEAFKHSAIKEWRLARSPRPKSDQGLLGEKMSESKFDIMMAEHLESLKI